MNKRIVFNMVIVLILVISVLTPIVTLAPHNGTYGPKVILFRLENDSIDSGTEKEIRSAIEKANNEHAVLIIVLETPGGELVAAENIVKAILNSQAPIIGYVYPRGAGAWSAGALILMACHIAVMAPGTSMGAAQPVVYGPSGFQPVNYSKIINPVATMFKAVARERGRNETAAELIVRSNLTFEAREALENNVIDIIATDINDLIRKINGTTVRTTYGNVTINLKGFYIEEHDWSLSGRFIHTISDPLISELLIMFGFYILLLGILSGHYHSVGLGIFLLLLGLIGSGFSVNIVSTVLLMLGITLLVVELTIIPGFGIVGVTGILMIITGLLMMPIYLPERWILPREYYDKLFYSIISIMVAVTGIFSIVTYKTIKARLSPPKIKLGMEGKVGEAIEDIKANSYGFVIIEGEYWRVRALEDVRKGDKVIVVKKEGPILTVKKA